MPIFAGHILGRTGVSEGWVEVEGGRIQRVGKDPHEVDAVATGWIVPSPVNAHTHVGDAFLRDVDGKPHNVASLVGPGGWKHRALAEADPATQAGATVAWADEASLDGTRAFIDFREGGAAGAGWLRSLDMSVSAIIHGRPRGPRFSEDEAAELLPLIDGMGWSGIRDAPISELEQWVDACRARRKPWGIHVSEDKRDDVESVIALEPDYVVHMTQGTKADFRALADERIPIVACPRSNAWFGMSSPLAAMRDAGCTLALGTDNAMLQDGSILNEAKAAHARMQNGSDEELLRMISWNARDIAGIETRMPKAGDAADLIVLPESPLRPKATKPGFMPNMDPEAWK